ncbi:SAM-dependent methyltransferase [Salipaludibacillus daqingensis]|uniref:SAM-dependent methyltransferase n=1 Tax=Salipaludibacillus daqingensis TaxID=3041001 RepID=UPI00247624C2|nr:methyltransferase domain-containing protein [Salipaludibacillus daqingensis]
MNQYVKTEKYDKNFVAKNLMGPNSMIILEELLENIPLKKGMRVLDLGCGNALTSIFLAKECDVQVFAVDLWVSATDNDKRLQQMKVDDLVIPIHADAHELPFADEYFDAVISVDAYHYFGNNDKYFDKYLRPLLKKDAFVAFAFPGMKYEVHNNIPNEMKELWDSEALEMWHSIGWWKEKFAGKLKDFEIKEMQCFDKAWSDWLSTDNPYAIGDREMMATDNGRYMNIISLTGKVI